MTRADGVRVAQPLFQAEGSGSLPTSALDLWLVKVDFAVAKSLNRLWHSRLPRINDPSQVMNLNYAAEFDGIYYAVAIWSHPVARLLPQIEWLELRRLAIAPDAPKNAATRMLAVMAMLIKKERPAVKRLISYQDTEAHTGTIYRAAGWELATLKHKGQTQWGCPSRPRPKAQSTAEKQRWEKIIR